MPRLPNHFLRREITLPAETNDRLQAEADRRGLPLTVYLRMLLIEHCAKAADALQESEASA